MKIGDETLDACQILSINFGVSLFFAIAAGFEWVLKDVFFACLVAGACFVTAVLDFICAKLDRVHYFPAVGWIVVGALIPIAAIWQGRLQGRSPF